MRVASLAPALLAAALAALPMGPAEAAVYRFTATTSSTGSALGFLEYDSSVFDGSDFQWITNASLLDLSFEVPGSGFAIDTFGPLGDSTIFDSTGPLPTVVGGSGFTGGTTFNDGVWIFGRTGVVLGTGTSSVTYEDVVWTTATVTGVPEPATFALLALGLAGVAAARRRA